MLMLSLLLALAFSVNAQTSQTYAATSTFTPAAGVTSVTVECWGGGGAGGSNTLTLISGGGGGGGGGGYSNSILTVNNSTIYPVNVGAGGIGTGSSGGGSWFNTMGTILANGGTRGESSNLVFWGGNSGNGGTLGIGDIKFLGGKGGTGRDYIPFVNRSGHGGPGGSSAGTGANGTSGPNPTWTIATAAAAPPGGGIGGDGGNENTNSGNGNPGSVPGGGGGGSGDDWTNSPGNGGNGRVIITYTCPTYNLTSTTATNICAPGLTSTVTLTSDPTGLPVGNYVVTYNRSSPIGTGLTTTMTVASAGSGTFTGTGFTTVWNSIITITNITSAGCSSAIVANNAANIVVSPSVPGAGIITGTASVCKGATGIIYNVPAIVNATSYVWTLPAGASITAGANTNTITVNFDATAVSGNITVYGINVCGNGTVSSNYSLTVNPSPIITGSLSVCGVGSATQLTGSGTATSWVSATPAIATVDNTNGLVTGVATGTSVITYTDNKGCGTTATVTVSPTPTTNMVPICQGCNGGSLTSLITCPTGATSSSGPNNPGSVAIADGPGNNNWLNHGNILSAGSPYATVDLTNASSTDYLQGSNYNLSIPADATINGITVSTNRQSTSTGIKDEELKLIKNGSILVTNKANTTTDWPTSMQIATYGGSSDLWGTTWTVAEINDLSFGVSLSVKNHNAVIRTASVDYIQISVTYTLPSTLDWYTVSSGGTKIGSGSPFDPVGVSGSGLTDTNTPSTTTFYAACSTSPGCRTATDFVITPSLPASVSIAAVPSGAICAGTSVTFTATPTKGGVTPAYQWKVNGTDAGTNSATYTLTTLADNDVIKVEMTSNATCVTGSPATSNEITISVTPTVGIPVFTLGTSSARDQGVGPFTYTATASNNTGITYSLDAASLAGGNTINSSTGEVTYTALWSWKSIITATATGCNGPKTADHVVGVNWCYALFTANGALSCAGASTITGDVGTFVGATTGFTAPAGPGILLPPGHIDAEASAASAQAAAQTVAVYNDLAAIPCTETHSEITLAGPTTLTPNVYCYGGALTISGDITLSGGPNAVFIFKINGALTTNTGSKIIMAGGASFRNVYWRVYGAVVLSGLEFCGTIVNEGAFTVNTGAAIMGRALSINGAIAITDNVITSDCYPLFSVPDNTKPIFVPPADISECVENLSNVAYNPLTTAINPDRPDYYTFSDIDTRLDLNTSLFSDDEPLTCPSNIRWQIDFSPASDFNSPYNLVTQPPITGLGQPSEHIGNILFPGDGVNFNPVVHHITWWIKDCAGNESPPQTRNITINPRPKIVKAPL